MILGLLLSLAVAVFFSIRAYHVAPRSRVNEPIRAWMSLPYIAHAYHIPPETLYQALNLPFVPQDRRPLMRIARDQHQSVQTLITILQAAIKRVQPLIPDPTPPIPGPTRSQS